MGAADETEPVESPLPGGEELKTSQNTLGFSSGSRNLHRGS